MKRYRVISDRHDPHPGFQKGDIVKRLCMFQNGLAEFADEKGTRAWFSPDDVEEVEEPKLIDLNPDTPTADVLGRCKHLQHVIVLGEDGEGNMVTDTNLSSGPEAVWLLEKAKLKILEFEYEQE